MFRNYYFKKCKAVWHISLFCLRCQKRLSNSLIKGISFVKVHNIILLTIQYFFEASFSGMIFIVVHMTVSEITPKIAPFTYLHYSTNKVQWMSEWIQTQSVAEINLSVSQCVGVLGQPFSVHWLCTHYFWHQ